MESTTPATFFAQSPEIPGLRWQRRGPYRTPRIRGALRPNLASTSRLPPHRASTAQGVLRVTVLVINLAQVDAAVSAQH